MMTSATNSGTRASKCRATAIMCVILAVSACVKRREAVVVPPQPSPPIVVRVDAPVPVYSPVPTALPDYVPLPVRGAVEREQADHAFTAGRYDEAIQAYENFLMLADAGDHRDEALFHLGLSYALRNNGEVDWQYAKSAFKRLVSEYPASPLKAPAVVILSLRTQADELAGNIRAREQAMRQLSTELERLKQIDAQRGRPLTP